MKYLFITPSFYPAFSVGGPIQSNLGLLSVLASKLNEVEVITTNRDGADRIQDTISYINGIKVFYFPSFFGHRFSPRLLFKMIWTFNRNDVVHVDDVFSIYTIAALILNLLHKKEFIFSPRGSLVTYVLKKERPLKKNLKIIFLKFLILLINNQYKFKFHFTSQKEASEAARFIKLFRKIHFKSFIVPNGFDKKSNVKRLCNKDENSINIVTLGRINKKKRIELGIFAVAEIRRRGHSVKYNIIGNDDDGTLDELKKLVTKNGLDEVVKFFDPLYSEKKYSFLIKHDVFLFTSKTENFGNVVLEALSVGLPVVVTRNLPWRNLSDMEIATVTNENSSEIADAIIQQTRKSPTNENFSSFVERYSWSIIGNNFMENVEHCND